MIYVNAGYRINLLENHQILYFRTGLHKSNINKNNNLNSFFGETERR